MVEKLGFFGSRRVWPGLRCPANRFLTLACFFGGSCGVPKGFAVVLSSQWGWLVGLVILGVPLATLATPAWGPPLLGWGAIPCTNSASAPEGWVWSIFLLPIPMFSQHMQAVGYCTLCGGGGAHGDKALVSGAGSDTAQMDPCLLMPRILWLLHLSFGTQGSTCQLFSNLEHHWSITAFGPAGKGFGG